jgi:hypothetical protein
MIVNYDNNTFVVQATGLLASLTRDKCFSLYAQSIVDNEKKFYNNDTRGMYYKTFYVP